MAEASQSIITGALGHIPTFLTGFGPLYGFGLAISAFVALLVGIKQLF